MLMELESSARLHCETGADAVGGEGMMLFVLVGGLRVLEGDLEDCWKGWFAIFNFEAHWWEGSWLQRSGSVGMSEPTVPKRVQDALDSSKSFGEFRDKRTFVFVHLFSGPNDVLGAALKEEAKKEHLKVQVQFYDKLDDYGSDLLKDEPFNWLVKEAQADAFDAGHAGFPCSSFSRARLREGTGPAPVRSKNWIYGLPGNSYRQQLEADNGTLLATRSVTIVGEVLQSQRRRQVSLAGTLENPPGSDDQAEGPAWILPEVESFLNYFGTTTALFNTCAYQQGQGPKWFKPARMSGCLEDLDKLSKQCTCPSWARHEVLIGKEKTARAAEYPWLLGVAYAKLLVASFKTTLQLEWWRHNLKVKTGEVNELQRKFLESKEKKQRTLWKQGALPDEGPSKRIWSADNILDTIRPQGDGPNKKQKREDNTMCIGGMRNPGKAIQRMTSMQNAGKDVARLWERFYESHPEARKTAETYGSATCALDSQTVDDWKAWLKKAWKVSNETEKILKEPWEFTSPLDPQMWDGWFKASGDPEKHLTEWIRRGAPLGMSREIQGCGIFPKAERGEAETDVFPEIEEQLGAENYKSFTEEPEHAKAELDRYFQKKFCVAMDKQAVKERFKAGRISRLALLLKQKEDGTVKRRVIMDLRRSGGNRRCAVDERIVLPRGQDALDGIRFLRTQLHRLGDTLASLRWKPEEDEDPESWQEMELFTADLSDAYCHLAIHPDEAPNCLSPGLRDGELILFAAVLFGYKGAPLLMGRLSSAMARLWQAIVPAHLMQLQVYMDDPLMAMQGPLGVRNKHLALLLYTSAVMGINIAYHKGSRGKLATWIGIKFEVDLTEGYLKLAVPEKMAGEVATALKSWEGRGMVAVKDLRSITGKASWIAGIVTRARWCTSILYAVLAAVEREEASGARSRDGRVKQGLVHVSRIELPRRWLIEVLSKPERLALRKEPLQIQVPSFGIFTDASPFGVGAILFDIDEKTGRFTPLQALEIPVTKEVAETLGVPFGEAASQGALEAWAVLQAIRKWNNVLRKQKVLLRSDSVVALAMVDKCSARTPTLNWIGAELALALERYAMPPLVAQHIPGAWNVEADWLSRPQGRGEKPRRLHDQGLPEGDIAEMPAGTPRQSSWTVGI